MRARILFIRERQAGQMKCAWCKKAEATDPSLYFEVFKRRFALCPVCANMSMGLMSVVNYLVRMSKRDARNLQRRKAI